MPRTLISGYAGGIPPNVSAQALGMVKQATLAAHYSQRSSTVQICRSPCDSTERIAISCGQHPHLLLAEQSQDLVRRLARLCKPPGQRDRQLEVRACLLPGLPVQRHRVQQRPVAVKYDALQAADGLLLSPAPPWLQRKSK